jgi:hypothetical protein
MPPDTPLPFYQPPTDKERLQHMADMPYGYRKGLCGKAKPCDVGLFDMNARAQLDMLDGLTVQLTPQAPASCARWPGKEVI